MARKTIQPVWACAVAAGVVVVGGAILHWHLVSSGRGAIETAEAEYRTAADANAATEQSIRTLRALRQSVRRFVKGVPPSANLTALLGSARDEETNTDGAVPEREIVTKPTVAGTPVARVPFSLQYRGSYQGTVSLLERLQNGELFTRVERIVIETGSSTETGKPLRVHVDFSTFARTSKELETWAQAE